MWLLTLQLFKISIDTQEKLRLNLHLSSVSELLEYGHMTPDAKFIDNTSMWGNQTQQPKYLIMIKCEDI
jgi:hypothetical protein